MKEPNIIFIVIDALRAKNLSCYGYSRETDSNISRIVKSGVVFENAYSTINATDPSLTSIFSGKFPRNHGILNHGEKITSIERKNIKNTRLLPEILKLKGYTTLGLDFLDRWHKRGYDYYIDAKVERKILNRLPKLLQTLAHFLYRKIVIIYHTNNEAQIITNHAINLVNKYKKEKFFLFIHYWDTHAPYNPPKEFIKFSRDLKTNDIKIKEVLGSVGNLEWRNYLKDAFKGAKTVNDVIDRYDGAIKFVDSNIGRLFKSLEDAGILENTLLIITSDHGESLGEHEIYFDHHGLYDESIKVPLIIWYPQFEPRRINAMVQHVDIMSTILEMLDIKHTNLDGMSLLPLINGELNEFRNYIYAEEAYTEKKKCIRMGNYKYILSDSKNDAVCRYCGKIHGGIEELYNLSNDPGETRNIAEEEKDVVEKLRGELLTIVKRLDDKRKNVEKNKIREEIKKLKTYYQF